MATHVCALFALFALTATPASSNSQPSAESIVQTALERQRTAFARKQLVNAILLFDRHYRIPQTGQYRDTIRLDQQPQTSYFSSTASTGIGLVSLAFGDMMEVIDDAPSKAIMTLEHLLGKHTAGGFETTRSRSGWYHHWINGMSGEVHEYSRGKFSTIDTALLAAGAGLAGNYFEAAARRTSDPDRKRMATRVQTLARELIMSIDWSTSIRDVDQGTIHLLLLDQQETGHSRAAAKPFTEYVLLPCIGQAVERRQGVTGPSTAYWQQHLSEVRELPMKPFGEVSVLSAGQKYFVSHFAHQFGYYFCRTLAKDPSYHRELAELSIADRTWFRRESSGDYPEFWWGLGAGVELQWDPDSTQPPEENYKAASLGRNPNHTFSPAIIAGFLPVDHFEPLELAGRSEADQGKIIDDLIQLKTLGQCVYRYDALEFLWRCSARRVGEKVSTVQSIDFSTYMLGLASYVPEIGIDFYTRYGF